MAKLGDTIVSSAITGKPLTLSDKAFSAVGKTNDEVQELKGQVAALLALVQSQGVAATPVEVVPVAKPTKAVSKAE
jgi:hypothetical protein